MDEVLVVGAGPTGLLLAAELARREVRVRIVDRDPAPGRESRALGIHARSLELFDRLGIVDEFLARGRRVAAFSMWDGGRRLARIGFGGLDSPFPYSLDIPQTDTEAILHAHLARAGVTVARGTELTGLAADPDGVDVKLRGPDGSIRAERVAYVVGCDGAHSTVRQLAGISFEGHGYAQDWLLADVALDWSRPADEVHIIFNPTGRATVCMPLPADRWRVICYFAGSPPDADLGSLLAERVPGPLAVADPTWMATFRTHRRAAATLRAGRVLLAGDAAHIHSPAGGQGLNTGLLEADNLAWKLAAVVFGLAPEALLDTYDAERAPVAAEVLDLSHRLVRLSALHRPWQRAARAVAIPLVTRVPGFRDRAARRISQLYVSHRGGPLAQAAAPRALTEAAPQSLARPTSGRLARAALRTLGPPASRPARGAPVDRRGALCPGDRAPDPSGLLHDTRHTLLVLDSSPLTALRRLAGHTRLAPRLVVVGEDDTATRRAYPAGVYLVRPDGYVAAIGLDAADAYLRRVFPLP